MFLEYLVHGAEYIYIYGMNVCLFVCLFVGVWISFDRVFYLFGGVGDWLIDRYIYIESGLGWMGNRKDVNLSRRVG